MVDISNIDRMLSGDVDDIEFALELIEANPELRMQVNPYGLSMAESYCLRSQLSSLRYRIVHLYHSINQERNGNT